MSGYSKVLYSNPTTSLHYYDVYDSLITYIICVTTLSFGCSCSNDSCLDKTLLENPIGIKPT